MNLPNFISLGRLLSVPATIWFIVSGHMSAAFWLFAAAGASDAIDGFIAKRFGMNTRLGYYLDPLADKALLVSVYITLGAAGYLDDWLVILVVSRDLLIVCALLLTYALGQRNDFQPLLISKANTLAQILLAAAVLAELGLELSLGDTVSALLYVVGATTVLSGATYLVQWVRTVSRVETSG